MEIFFTLFLGSGLPNSFFLLRVSGDWLKSILSCFSEEQELNLIPGRTTLSQKWLPIMVPLSFIFPPSSLPLFKRGTIEGLETVRAASSICLFGKENSFGGVGERRHYGAYNNYYGASKEASLLRTPAFTKSINLSPFSVYWYSPKAGLT